MSNYYFDVFDLDFRLIINLTFQKITESCIGWEDRKGGSESKEKSERESKGDKKIDYMNKVSVRVASAVKRAWGHLVTAAKWQYVSS